MPSATTRKSPSPAQTHEYSVEKLSPARPMHPKPPQSHYPSEINPDGTSFTLGDVTFMRLPEVKTVTGLGKTSIYELIRDKSFPAPVRLGPRAVAWVRSEIRQWALERVQASRSAA